MISVVCSQPLGSERSDYLTAMGDQAVLQGDEGRSAVVTKALCPNWMLLEIQISYTDFFCMLTINN